MKFLYTFKLRPVSRGDQTLKKKENLGIETPDEDEFTKNT